MAKSFHSGGSVNATNWSVWAPGSVYTPGYPMISTRQALNGNRPIRITNWAPDYATGSYSALLYYPSSISTGATFANSGGSYTFRIVANSGSVTPGRSAGDGYSMYWDSDGSSVSGGISNTVFYEEVPAAPTNLIVTPSGGSAVNVSWTAPADNGGTAITQYLIQVSTYADFSVITSSSTVSAPATSGSVSGLSNGVWYVRVLARNSVAAAFSTYGPASAVTTVQTGPVWTFAGEASFQARVTDGGDFSDPGGPFQLAARLSVASIPVGLECFGHLAFYAENVYNDASILVTPSVAWFGEDNRLISETVSPDEIVPAETTHVFSWEGLGKPRNAVYAELTVTIPRFFSVGVPNVRTIGTYDPVNSTRLYIDGGMISNREVDYFDGSFPDSGWFGTPGLSTSYQILGNTEPLFDMATDGGGKVLSIDAGEIREETIRAGVFPVEIDGPIPSDITPAPLGSYNVIDSNGSSVPSSIWSQAGGFIQARPGDEWGQIILTLFAPNEIPGFTGPYKIASMAGTTEVAELRLSGRGVKETPVMLRWPTGADSTVTTETGATIDTPALATLEDAYTAGPWAVQSIGGPNPVLTATISLKDVDAFGVLPGSLIRYRDSQYRVTSVRLNGLQVTITAEWFVRVQESDALWIGDPVEDRDAIWVGRKAKDGVIAPLRTE
jgi:hypothetical protein